MCLCCVCSFFLFLFIFGCSLMSLPLYVSVSCLVCPCCVCFISLVAFLSLTIIIQSKNKSIHIARLRISYLFVSCFLLLSCLKSTREFDNCVCFLLLLLCCLINLYPPFTAPLLTVLSVLWAARSICLFSFESLELVTVF